MRSFAMTRDCYKSNGDTLLFKDESLGIEVWGKSSPKITAMAFVGKAQKPVWNYAFNSQDRLNFRIEELKKSRLDKIKGNAERKARRESAHDVKLGDVFVSMWGYEQTNIDYYQCTNVMGKMIEVREISAESETTGHDAGECVPCVGRFIGEAMRKRVNMAYGHASIRIDDVRSARKLEPIATVGGKALYGSHSWTAGR